jgi:8-amino-7-oxononanoate synthase
MMQRTKGLGLSGEDRTKLLQRLVAGRAAAPTETRPPAAERKPVVDDLSALDSYKQFQMIRSVAEILGIADPFFRAHDGIAGAETKIGGRSFVNFSSYNYLGLNGHPEIAEAAKAAIDRYGTSVSASRIVSGERPIHRELEQRLAALHGSEDCITLVSGHATNVSVIGHLLGKGDLILHDAFIHNSAVQGAQLSGALRLTFPHNDAAAARRLLEEQAPRHRRVLVVVEGHYSMDGDLADLPAFAQMTRQHKAWLLVDEAHSVGVVGATGRGAAEHFGLGPDSADLWMGTLSKTLAGCGGYIAGRRELIDYLKLSTPGFMYSVGMSPPVAAAAIAALGILEREPERVARLHAVAARFLAGARDAGLDAGSSVGLGIVPIITGSSILAARLSDALFRRGINVQPILYPAVPEQSARLRFFLSSDHTHDQIDATISALAEEHARLSLQSVDLSALASELRQRHF